jgi:bacteriocin-like protein
MKTQELNAKELMEINGGGLFGGDSSSSSGLAGGLGIGNLLSFGTASQDGDEASASTFSLGNGISASLEKITSSVFN